MEGNGVKLHPGVWVFGPALARPLCPLTLATPSTAIQLPCRAPHSHPIAVKTNVLSALKQKLETKHLKVTQTQGGRFTVPTGASTIEAIKIRDIFVCVGIAGDVFYH